MDVLKGAEATRPTGKFIYGFSLKNMKFSGWSRLVSAIRLDNSTHICVNRTAHATQVFFEYYLLK